MPESQQDAPAASPPSGATLDPLLHEACGGRLGPIEWFRATWQRGGALTGNSTWTDDAGPHKVVVKVPVEPNERFWTARLGELRTGERLAQLPTGRVFASGERLGGDDSAWLVVEKLDGHPLPVNLHEPEVLDLMRAAAAFQARALELEPNVASPERWDWPDLLDHSRHALEAVEIPHVQRWNEAIKKAQKALPSLAAEWMGRPINAWCHGDLHPGNAMRRRERCVLIDLALIHPGHWIEDALYLERQYWGHEELLHGVRPVTQLNRYRKKLGLDPGPDHGHLADVRRVLMAACVPGLINREGNPKYVEAALGLLEVLLPRFH